MSEVEQASLQVTASLWPEVEWLPIVVIAGALLTVGIYASWHGVLAPRRFRRRDKRRTDTDFKLVKYRDRKTVILIQSPGDTPPGGAAVDSDSPPS